MKIAITAADGGQSTHAITGARGAEPKLVTGGRALDRCEVCGNLRDDVRCIQVPWGMRLVCEACDPPRERRQ